MPGNDPCVESLSIFDGTQGAGARLLANVTDCDPEQIRIGDRVQIWFGRVSDTFAVPRFRPLSNDR